MEMKHCNKDNLSKLTDSQTLHEQSYTVDSPSVMFLANSLHNVFSDDYNLVRN